MVEAWFWGALAGSALLLGAALGWFVELPQRVVAAFMAFGAGVLVSALAFDLVAEAYDRGGLAPVAVGFLGGSAFYTAFNIGLSRRGAKHRKRSGHAQSQPSDAASGAAIALGALLDGIPESAAVGISLLGGGAVSVSTVLAIFLSNVPEGLSSSAGMKRAGRSAAYVFGIWTAIALASGLASLAGFALGTHLSPGSVAAILAVAAGGILTMLADTMIPEAFDVAHEFAGLITVAGFLVAFVVSRWAGR